MTEGFQVPMVAWYLDVRTLGRPGTAGGQRRRRGDRSERAAIEGGAEHDLPGPRHRAAHRCCHSRRRSSPGSTTARTTASMRTRTVVLLRRLPEVTWVSDGGHGRSAQRRAPRRAGYGCPTGRSPMPERVWIGGFVVALVLGSALPANALHRRPVLDGRGARRRDLVALAGGDPGRAAPRRLTAALLRPAPPLDERCSATPRRRHTRCRCCSAC